MVGKTAFRVRKWCTYFYVVSESCSNLIFSGCPFSFLEMTRTIKIVTSTYLSHSFAKQYTLQSTMPKERLSWKDTNLALSKFDGSKTKLGMVIII